MADYLDKIYAEATLFDQLQTKGYDDLLIALKLADDTITKRILATNGEWTKTKLIEIQRLIQNEISTAYGGLFAQTQLDVEESANLVYGLMLNAINSKVPTDVMKQIINKKAIVQDSYKYTIIDGKTVGKDLLKSYEFEELFKLTEQAHSRQLKNVLASGVAQGLPPQDIVRLYGIEAENLSKGQVVGNVFTAISNARTEARSESYRELENLGISKGYIYNSVIDFSTSLWCRQHSQRRYKTLEAINKDLNTHFRCRSMAQMLTGSETEKERLAKEESYEEWFIKQPKDLQKATLTNRKYKAFLEGKYKVKTVADLDKKTTLAEIKKVLANNYID